MGLNRTARDGGAMDAVIKEKKHCDRRVLSHCNHRGSKSIE